MTRNLLTVDWDYFFDMPHPSSTEGMYLFDWAQAESRLMIDMIWPSRASTFLRNDMELPTVNDTWQTFSERFTFSDDFDTVYVGESHTFAARMRDQGFDSIWLYDAHHDAGYRGKEDFTTVGIDRVVSCENWMMGFHLWNRMPQKNMHVRYPPWKPWALNRDYGSPSMRNIDEAMDDGEPNDVVFDGLYICRSGAWVPPWCDQQFVDFVYTWDADVSDEYDEYVEGIDPMTPRDFDIDQARKEADAMRKLMERNIGINR